MCPPHGVIEHTVDEDLYGEEIYGKEYAEVLLDELWRAVHVEDGVQFVVVYAEIVVILEFALDFGEFRP